MALLTVQSLISQASVLFAPVAAAGGGDTFQNTGRELVYVKNGGGSPITVTIPAQRACSFGVSNAAHDRVVTVAAGAERWIGPLDPTQFADASGISSITYSGVTSVTVAVVRATT